MCNLERPFCTSINLAGAIWDALGERFKIRGQGGHPAITKASRQPGHDPSGPLQPLVCASSQKRAIPSAPEQEQREWIATLSNPRPENANRPTPSSKGKPLPSDNLTPTPHGGRLPPCPRPPRYPSARISLSLISCHAIQDDVVRHGRSRSRILPTSLGDACHQGLDIIGHCL